MSNTKKIIGGVIIFVVGLLIGWFVHSGNLGGLGPVSPSANFNNIIASENVGSPLFQFLNSVNAVLFSETSTGGTCAAATSTWFDNANPFAATSTAMLTMWLPGNATSTTMYVGTTTASSGITAASQLGYSGTLVAGAVEATSSGQSYLISGQNSLLGTGQISAGTTVTKTILVGPTENVAAYATSTYGGIGALNYTQNPCTTWMLRWDKS